MRDSPFDNDPDRPDDNAGFRPNPLDPRIMSPGDATRHDALTAARRAAYADPEQKALMDAQDARVMAVHVARAREHAAYWCERWGIEL